MLSLKFVDGYDNMKERHLAMSDDTEFFLLCLQNFMKREKIRTITVVFCELFCDCVLI